MTGKTNPKSGCCSTVFSRLLCSGGSQTYPSDRFPELQTSQFYEETEKKEPLCNSEDQIQASSSYIAPSVVAQLMGLDSIPEVNWVGGEKNERSVARSKSVNFMEYLLKNDNGDEEETRHKRVGKTSFSFREVPSSTRNHHKKHDLLLLYLDKLDEKKQIGSKSRRFEKGFEESKQETAEKVKNDEMIIDKKEKEGKKYSKKVLKLKDEPRRVHKNKKREAGIKKVSRFVSLRKKDDVCDKSCPNSITKSPTICSKNRRNRVQTKEEEPESSSENSNSSPVSVLELDLDDYLIHDLYSLPGDSVSSDLNSRTGSSPSRTKKKDGDETDEYMVKLMSKLAELTEEVIKESTWVSKGPSKFEDVEGLCIDFGQDIIDHVLDQLVDELVCIELTQMNCLY